MSQRFLVSVLISVSPVLVCFNQVCWGSACSVIALTDGEVIKEKSKACQNSFRAPSRRFFWNSTFFTPIMTDKLASSG